MQSDAVQSHIADAADAIGFYERLGATVLPDWRICRVSGEALQRFAD